LTTPLKVREQGEQGLGFLTLKSVAGNLCQRTDLKESITIQITLLPNLAHLHRKKTHRSEDEATMRNERLSHSTRTTKGKRLTRKS